MNESNFSQGVISKAIYLTYKSKRFWTEMVENSSFNSGPLDGGCRCAAESIVQAVGKGELVYIASQLNGGQLEHYGARIEGIIYDFGGCHETPERWVECFKKEEQVYGRDLFFVDGIVRHIDNVPQDTECSNKVAGLLRKRMIKAQDSGLY